MTTRPTYALQVDWTGDGAFTGSGENVIGDAIGKITAERGRNFPSPLSGRVVPGTLTATLLNTSGKYSTSNPSSALVDQLLTGRAVRLQINGSTRWQGYLSNIYADRIGNTPIARLEAKGPLSRVAEVKIWPPASVGAYTGTIVGLILDAAGWPAGLRDIAAGQTITSRWFQANVFALAALREIEETELGLLKETRDGKIAFEARNYRLSGARLVAQALYSDAPGTTYPYLNPIRLNDPIKDVVNRVTAAVTPYAVGGNAVLWTLSGETPILAPGETRTWIAESNTGLYVDAWVNTAFGVDIIASNPADYSYLSASYTKRATQMEITVTNSAGNPGLATLTKVQARGTPVDALTSTRVVAEDLVSQQIRGLRTYNHAAPWLSSTNTAQDYATVLLSRFKDQQTLPTLPFNPLLSSALLSEMLTRDISDRVTIVGQQPNTALGLAADYFVESIKDVIDLERARWDCEMSFSPAAIGSNFWILGTSVLGSTTIAGY